MESQEAIRYRDGAGQRRPLVHRSGGSEDFFFVQYAEIGPQLRSQSIIHLDVRLTVRLGV